MTRRKLDLRPGEGPSEIVTAIPLGQMIEFGTGATRSGADGKLDYRGFISPLAMKRFAQYMDKHRRQADGQLRQSDNWKKGIPLESYTESLVRHVFEFWEHWDGEDLEAAEETMCAIMLKVQGWLHEREKEKG